MITTVSFDFDKKTERDLGITEIPTALATGAYLWIDADQASKDEATALLRELGAPEEALAQAFGPDQEGRHDVYDECVHFALTETRLGSGRLETAHVDVVVGERYLLTYRRQETEFLRQMRRTYRKDFLSFAKSPGFLLYEIADHLMDSYRKTLRQIGESVEKIQLRLFGEVDDQIFVQVADLTTDILMFRKTMLASRELLHELASRRSAYISESTQPFLERMAETLSRLCDDLTTEREVLNETLNLYMGMVSHRTNKVVNRLTVISAIFLPLTFLCGVYGMNFDREAGPFNMPELYWAYGYPMFWTLTILISAALLVYMRRKRWL